jgi:hypothetical protein
MGSSSDPDSSGVFSLESSVCPGLRQRRVALHLFVVWSFSLSIFRWVGHAKRYALSSLGSLEHLLFSRVPQSFSRYVGYLTGISRAS